MNITLYITRNCTDHLYLQLDLLQT